eukprot:gnl/MRDRNA2_/MRDRNA2_34001_c0_seq1.p1 gnl/MRDRNA2_/MRDRNA2_34001_c0~~gnl/MRDRNA2_/MRDRNA2_34001_c0_seq1.p1  ORF type:complete len:630 (+),score=140.39 gnl/MRDRNA2_/MRDRNA2_34001_c0_seq1:69-1958(+)
MDRHIRVNVFSLKGETFEVDVTPDMNVQSLKEFISEKQSSFPALCQKLLMDEVELDNASTFAQLCGSDASLSQACLSMCVFISFEPAYAQLRSTENRNAAAPEEVAEAGRVAAEALMAISKVVQRGDEEVIQLAFRHAGNPLYLRYPEARYPEVECCAALTLLAKAGNIGDFRIVGRVARFLRCPDDAVRCAALEVLAEVAEEQDEDIIALVISQCQFHIDFVRGQTAAIRALTKVAPPGHKDALAVITPRLDDVFLPVTVACMDAIAKLVIPQQGDENLMNAVGVKLQSPYSDVRCAAAQALSKIVPQSDERAVSALMACLHDEAPAVVCTALSGLGHVVKFGDKYDATTVAGSLGHTDRDVRRAAVEFLARIAPKDDEFIITAVAFHLENDNCDIRNTAADALAQVAHRSDKHMISEVCSRLEHQVLHVRSFASLILGKLTDPDDENVLAAVVDCLFHKKASVKCTALKCLGEIVRQDNEAIMASVAALTEDPSGPVKQAALKTLGKLAPQGNEVAANTSMARLEDEDSDVRCVALEVFTRVAQNRECKVSAVLRCLEDHDWWVRQAALEILPTVAETCNESTKTAILSLLGHDADLSPSVRCTALSVLGKMAPPNDSFIINTPTSL